MVGQNFERHEYVLSDETGNKALLVCGSRPGTEDWWLFTPFQPVTPLSPQQAAAIRWGQTVNVEASLPKQVNSSNPPFARRTVRKRPPQHRRGCFLGSPAQALRPMARAVERQLYQFFPGTITVEKGGCSPRSANHCGNSLAFQDAWPSAFDAAEMAGEFRENGRFRVGAQRLALASI